MEEVSSYFQKKLKDDEEIILFVRPYGLVYFWWFLLSFVLIGGSLYYLFYLLDFGVFGKIIFLAIFILGIATLVKTLIIWRFSAVMITNFRVIDFDRHSLFVRQISEAPFYNIQDITLEQKGFWPMVLKFGTIKIQTAGSNNVLELQHIKNPKEVHEVLVEIHGENNSRKKSINNDWAKDERLHDLFRILEKKKQEIGKEKFANSIDEWLRKNK